MSPRLARLAASSSTALSSIGISSLSRPSPLGSIPAACRSLNLNALFANIPNQKNANSEVKENNARELPRRVKKTRYGERPADFHYPLPTLPELIRQAPELGNNTVQGRDFNSYLVPLYWRNWGISKYHMKEKRDREEKWGLMLEKSFSFARKTGGKSDVMEFLEKMSELRHAKKQIVHINFRLREEWLMVNVVSPTPTIYKPSIQADPSRGADTVIGITYNDISFAYALERKYTAYLRHSEYKPESVQRPWWQRPPNLDSLDWRLTWEKSQLSDGPMPKSGGDETSKGKMGGVETEIAVELIEKEKSVAEVKV